MNSKISDVSKTNDKLKFWGAKIFQFGLAGALFELAQTVSVVAAIQLAPIACWVAGPICHAHPRFGMLFIGATILLTGISAATLFLHAVSKLKWLNAVAVTLLSTGSFYLFFGAISTVFQAEMSNFFLLSLLLLIASYIFYGTVFYKIKRPWVTIITASSILTIYIVGIAGAQSWLQDIHQQLEDQKNLQTIRSLPFAIYAPTYIPHGYHVVESHGIKAYMDSPDDYELTYDTGAQYAPGVPHLFFNERKLTSDNPASACAKPYITPLGPCVSIGRTSVCEVYYQFPSQEGKDYAESFCTIGKTSMSLTSKGITTEEIVKIFNSMQPANADKLHEEIKQNTNR